MARSVEEADAAFTSYFLQSSEPGIPPSVKSEERRVQIFSMVRSIIVAAYLESQMNKESASVLQFDNV